MKKILLLLLSVFFVMNTFAGDAAVFDDIGFSADGKYYLFGQYGKTDKTYKAWAEIFTVDVAKNDFVKGEVYKTVSSEADESSGKKCYENLKEKNEWKISKYKAAPSDAKTLLYLRESETKKSAEEIVFKDFENSTPEKSIYYHIKIVPAFEGSGKNCKSKYYIDLKRTDENSNVISQHKIGTPDFKRKGITDYQIDKIFTDKSGKNLVFIIQKTLEDENGTSIRYMVETFSM